MGGHFPPESNDNSLPWLLYKSLFYGFNYEVDKKEDLVTIRIFRVETKDWIYSEGNDEFVKSQSDIKKSTVYSCMYISKKCTGTGGTVL